MTRFATALWLTLALAAPAAATGDDILPTLFDVTGVAADDVLNIRARPDASAEILGSVPADATGVEVVREQAGWAEVNAGESTGWVSMRYLTPQAGVWVDGQLPASFRCLGTEPFWDVKVEGGDLVLRSPEDEAGRRGAIQLVPPTYAQGDPSRVVVAEGMTLVSRPQICSDGMSDRVFGLDATLILNGDQPSVLRGCCLIQP